jgi:predicted outer membrane repeat protein
VNLRKNNTFLNNYAAIQGGAISFRSASYTVINDGVTMKNNTAGVIKSGVSSYAKSVSFNLVNNATVGGSYVVKYNASDSQLNAAAKQ